MGVFLWARYPCTCSSFSPSPLQGYLAHKKPPPPPDPTVGPYLGSYGGPRGGGRFLMSEVLNRGAPTAFFSKESPGFICAGCVSCAVRVSSRTMHVWDFPKSCGPPGYHLRSMTRFKRRGGQPPGTGRRCPTRVCDAAVPQESAASCPSVQRLPRMVVRPGTALEATRGKTDGFFRPTPIQMPPRRGGICGRLT